METYTIECIKYTPYNKGYLIGFADFYIHEFGMEIYGCQFFCKNGKKWISFPAKENGVDVSGKKKYFAHIKFREKKMIDVFSAIAVSVLEKEIAKKESEKSKNLSLMQDLDWSQCMNDFIM